MSTTIPYQLSRNTLSELYNNNSILSKNRLANKAINDIKYGVLQINNLGVNKIYVYEYKFSLDDINTVDNDYFENILFKLPDIFYDSTITYKVKQTNETVLLHLDHRLYGENPDYQEVLNSRSGYNNTRYNYPYEPYKSIITDDNGISSIQVSITIDWSGSLMSSN